jgi:aryl-alcohol dehydrogenase-like predicted oxidoreductase
MKLGKTTLEISNQGLGCMSISEFYGDPLPDDKGIALIVKAFDEGVNFFDTADVYGYGRNEALLGKAVAELLKKGVERHQLIIATKCGIIRDEKDPTKRGIDNSSAYVTDCCHKSLNRLGSAVAHIDLFYIHRIANAGEQIDEAMHAMAALLEHGKIKAVGLSEASAETIKKANAALLKYTAGQHQITAVQSEYSLMTRTAETNGVLAVCRDLGITFVAYSPLSRALLTDDFTSLAKLKKGDFRKSLPRFQAENFIQNKKLVEHVNRIAEKKKCHTAQLALAWVLHQPNVVPIPGTTRAKHLLMNIQAGRVKLSADEIKLLNNLGCASGYRYTEAAMKVYGLADELEPV